MITRIGILMGSGVGFYKKYSRLYCISFQVGVGLWIIGHS